MICEHSSYDSHGHHIVILFVAFGYRCGYVGVPADHFSVPYAESAPLVVHGGITFAGPASHHSAFNPALFYFGFDAAHHGDGTDLNALRGYELPIPQFPNYGTPRAHEYMLENAHSLSDQLSQLELFI